MWTDPNQSPEEWKREAYEAQRDEEACQLCAGTGKLVDAAGEVPCPRCSNE